MWLCIVPALTLPHALPWNCRFEMPVILPIAQPDCKSVRPAAKNSWAFLLTPPVSQRWREHTSLIPQFTPARQHPPLMSHRGGQDTRCEMNLVFYLPQDKNVKNVIRKCLWTDLHTETAARIISSTKMLKMHVNVCRAVLPSWCFSDCAVY